MCTSLFIASTCPAQNWIDFEFINETGLDMKASYELKFYTAGACDDPLGGSSGWSYPCVPADDVNTVQGWDTRFIAQVDVTCNCGNGVDATIYCGDEPVIFQCGLTDLYIMGLALHGWRVEPYTP